MLEGGFDPGQAKIFLGEDRIREQEHGLSLLYSDWRVFQTFHPEQRELYELLGPYWYQYPQGESTSMVRDRVRLFTNMLVREYSGKVVYLVSHHLTKLCIRANYERLTPEQFIDLDNHQKPINGGVTIYKGNPEVGTDGKLELIEYNKKLY
jgi:broad specificity phosphatase PhoE